MMSTLLLLICRRHVAGGSVFCLVLLRRAACRPLTRTHNSRICIGDEPCPSTESGLRAIGLVYCRRDARAARAVSCTGLYGISRKKAGFRRPQLSFRVKLILHHSTMHSEFLHGLMLCLGCLGGYICVMLATGVCCVGCIVI